MRVCITACKGLLVVRRRSRGRGECVGWSEIVRDGDEGVSGGMRA